MKRNHLIPCACAALIAGCATPPAAVQPAPFERCIAAVTKNHAYTGELLRAAQWCRDNQNGGIEP